MKRLLVIMLVILLTIAFATPVFADTPAGGKPGPVPDTDYPLILNEPIVPGTPAMWIAAYANSGEITRHVVKTNGRGSTEDSWFEITSFDGWILFYPSLTGLNESDIHNIIFAESIQEIHAADIKVTFHQGTQANQPLITIRSSQPIEIPSPFNQIPGLGDGPYTNIQIMGITITSISTPPYYSIIPTIIHAK